jgi:hypothetical protein
MDNNRLIAPEQNTQALDQAFIDILADIRQRNDAMLFRDLPPRVIGYLSSALSDTKVNGELLIKFPCIQLPLTAPQLSLWPV